MLMVFWAYLRGRGFHPESSRDASLAERLAARYIPIPEAFLAAWDSDFNLGRMLDTGDFRDYS
jgi:hypothetical protein